MNIILFRQSFYRSGKSLIHLQTNFVKSVSTSATLRSKDANEKKQDFPSKAAKISQAMREYVKKAEEYTTLIGNERSEFELGKRHLANIMGFEEEDLSQNQIDTAISYLLPSGLFEPRARPIMKPPEAIFPKKKPAQFGIDGRPYHYLFYTGKPSYFELMNEGAFWIKRLESVPIDSSTGHEEKPDKSIDLTGSDWVDLSVLRSSTLEKLDETNHRALITLLSRISAHKNANTAREFLFRFRKQLTAEKPSQLRLPLNVDVQGRNFVDSFGSRKWARADVRVYSKGNGLIKINGQSLLQYFPGMYEREQILFPIQYCGLLGKVDVMASINKGASGTMAEAGALRLALARAMCSLCPDHVVDRLRLAGLLTRDSRRRERKKPGQVGARRKFTWVKR